MTWYYGIDSDISYMSFSRITNYKVPEIREEDRIVRILPIIEEVGHEFEALISRFEGLVLKVYNDLGYSVKKGKNEAYLSPKKGTLHIGYGHKLIESERVSGLIKIVNNGKIRIINIKNKITKEQSFQILRNDAKQTQDMLNKYININLNQNEYDAFASYIFNVGYRGLFEIKNGRPQFNRPSKFLVLVNKDDIKNAVKYMDIVKSGGKVLRGLVKRRNEEQKLALKPIKD